ncbi:MAG: YggT family protein [Dehalococcoidia bacterium]
MSGSQIILIIIQILTFVIFLRVILSWIVVMMRTSNEFLISAYRILEQITDPILAPLRRIIPSAGGLDFSPMIAIILLWILGMVVAEALS